MSEFPPPKFIPFAFGTGPAGCQAAQDGGCYCSGECRHPSTYPPYGYCRTKQATKGEVASELFTQAIEAIKRQSEQAKKETDDYRVKAVKEIQQALDVSLAQIHSDPRQAQKAEPNRHDVLYLNVQRELIKLYHEIMRASDKGKPLPEHTIMGKITELQGKIENFAVLGVVPEGWSTS